MVSALGPAGHARDGGAYRFLDDAVGPSGDWRSPTADERQSLVGDQRFYRDCDLLVVAFDRLSGVLDANVELRRRGILDFVPAAVSACIDGLSPYCATMDGLVCQGAWIGPGGLSLVTHDTDPASPRRIGLHVDDWDQRAPGARVGGRRRVGVNLGLAPRYLVFLRDPLSGLVAKGRLPAYAAEGLSAPNLVRAYLVKNLDAPAFRVRIDPGEAYIVNAEDVIHDGASHAHDTLDISLHFLGHFRPPPVHGQPSIAANS
jgi:hypothetical protein